MPQSSSNALRTISGVIGGASAGDMITGKRPLVSTRAGVRPRRARSEMTAPIGRRSWAASSRAASITSSAMSRVVRTQTPAGSRAPGSNRSFSDESGTGIG